MSDNPDSVEGNALPTAKELSTGRKTTVYGREFHRFAREAIHPRVSELLEELPRGRLLDLPSGTGALSYRLYKEGFDVTACDIRPDLFEAPEIPVVWGDLRQKFPFDDDAFDYATYVEGPEHAENPLFAFREFARVLCPGGRLLLTIPNYTNLESRLKFLFWGSSEKAVSQGRFARQFGGDPAMLHISPLTYTQLRFLLETCGFQIERIAKDKIKWKQYLLLPLALLIRLASWIAGKKGQKKWWLRQANSSDILLGGNTLLILARLEGRLHEASRL